MIRAVLSPRSEAGRIVVSVDTDHEGHQDLWWETVGGTPPPVPERLDVAALALVTKAMNFTQDLHLDGAVSWTLLANLEEFVAAWAIWRPDIFHPVSITAAKVIDDRGSAARHPTRTVVACSGGVDSTYALYANARGLLGLRSLDVAAAVLIQGFDIPLDDSTAWDEAFHSVRVMADAVDVPTIGVRTNWREVADPEWEMSFGTALAACLSLFSDRASVATVASDNSYRYLTLPWGSNPITQPLLSSTHMRTAYVAGAVTRTEKCAAIGSEAAVRRHIRVCWEGPDKGRNCGSCEKCNRTKINFAAAGYEIVDALGPLDLHQLKATTAGSAAARDLYRELASETSSLDTAVAREVARIAEADVSR